MRISPPSIIYFDQGLIMFKKASLGDQLASQMSTVIDSDNHRSIFGRPSFDKFAAKKSEDKDDDKGEKDDDKGDKKDKKNKKNKRATQLHAAIEGIARISAALDEIGFVRSSLHALAALETIVKEAENASDNDLNDCGDMASAEDIDIFYGTLADSDNAKKDEAIIDLLTDTYNLPYEIANKLLSSVKAFSGKAQDAHSADSKELTPEQKKKIEEDLKKVQEETDVVIKQIETADSNDISEQDIVEAIRLPIEGIELADLSDLLKSEEPRHEDSDELLKLLSELGDLSAGDLEKLHGDDDAMAAVAKTIASNLVKAAAQAAKK